MYASRRVCVPLVSLVLALTASAFSAELPFSDPSWRIEAEEQRLAVGQDLLTGNDANQSTVCVTKSPQNRYNSQDRQ